MMLIVCVCFILQSGSGELSCSSGAESGPTFYPVTNVQHLCILTHTLAPTGTRFFFF